MSESASQKRNLRLGVLLVVVGVVTALVGAFAVHLIGLPTENAYGVELYSWVPRGWQPKLIAQIVSLTGVLMIIAGIGLSFVYGREMTWARATIGAFLFTALMIIFFGVVPNEFLTLTQSTLDWSVLKLALPACSIDSSRLCIPDFLTLGNPVSLSAAAVKDMIGQGYILTVTGAIVVTMWKWQERSKRLAQEGPAPEISKYGRPLTKVER